MENIEILVRFALVGAGATLVMDLWAAMLRAAFGLPSLDYALVGRWVGHMRRGAFRHRSIADAAPIGCEQGLGWGLHYATGVGFALIFAVWVGGDWLNRPDLPDALIFGGLTVLVPFLVMQPAFGVGLAASRTRAPWRARLRSLNAHLSFGLGLYLAAQMLLRVA